MQKLTKTKTYNVYTPEELTEELVENAAFFVFDDHEFENDESAYWKDGKLRLSSYANGLIDWDEEKGQYVHSYHWSKHDVGQLKHAAVHLKTKEVVK